MGEGEACFIVAEAGSNHNGSLEQALRLIDVAVEAGADAVKFQSFKADRLYTRSAGQSDYLLDSRPIYDIIHNMEMPDEWVPKLAQHCREKAIEFMSTPFDEESADLLDPYLNVFKTASYEMTHSPLLKHVARKGKPMFISTGTADLEEVLEAVETIRSVGHDQIVVLQCTASYPTPLEAANLRAMTTLREATGQPVGLSDHTREPLVAPLSAVALGACVVEKHFTLSNRLPGPDHKFALEPQELAAMVRHIRESERALGHGRKELLPEEKELHAFARRSVFATRDIQRGDPLTKTNIAVLRSGNAPQGLLPDTYEETIGKRAARAIKADMALQPGDVA